jgi:predicted nucleotidyltransferase
VEKQTLPALPLSEMTERIVRGFAPIAVILHGSQARGEAERWSDVDLLVVLPGLARQAHALLDAVRRDLAEHGYQA